MAESEYFTRMGCLKIHAPRFEKLDLIWGIAFTLDYRIYPLDNHSGSIHFRAQLPQVREADACGNSSHVNRKGPL